MGYYWYLNGRELDPESLHHFLGVSFEEYIQMMECIAMRKGSGSAAKSTPDLIENKLVLDCGGKPHRAEATPFTIHYSHGQQ